MDPTQLWPSCLQFCCHVTHNSLGRTKAEGSLNPNPRSVCSSLGRDLSNKPGEKPGQEDTGLGDAILEHWISQQDHKQASLFIAIPKNHVLFAANSSKKRKVRKTR